MIINVNIDTETGIPEGYMTVQQASRKWRVSDQMIRIYASHGILDPEPLYIANRIFISEFCKKPKMKPGRPCERKEE